LARCGTFLEKEQTGNAVKERKGGFGQGKGVGRSFRKGVHPPEW